MDSSEEPEPKTFSCEHCEASFLCKNNKIRHLANIHGIVIKNKKLSKLVFECNLCGMKFINKTKLIEHQENFHSQRKKNRKEKRLKDFYLGIKDSLPPGMDYRLVMFQPDLSENEKWFYAKIEFTCPNKASLIQWKSNYQKLNKIPLEKVKSRNNLPGGIIFQVTYQCNYTSYHSNITSCGPENCTASLTLTLIKERNRNKALIFIKNTHNHFDNNNLPSEEMRKKFMLMYYAKLNVAQALALNKADMEIEYSDYFYMIANDRSLLPTQRWAYGLYLHVIRKLRKHPQHDELTTLSKTVCEYNDSLSQTSAHLQILSDSDFILAIMTPFMRRASLIKEAGDVMFIDTSNDMDRYKCKAYLFMVPSDLGGLPIGSVIVSNDNPNMLSLALRAYKTLITQECFGGRGKLGPKLIIVNNSSEKDSFSLAFKDADYLVSIFEVLKTMWQFILDPVKGIPIFHKYELFGWIKKMVFAKNESQLDEIFKVLCLDNIVQNYEHFIDYALNLYNEKNKWAIYTKMHLIFEQNNIWEIALKIAKERNFDYIKAFSPEQLFYYIISDMTSFYEMKMLENALGNPNEYLNRKFLGVFKHAKNMKWKHFTGIEHVYELKSDNGSTHVVDSEVGLCSCPVGMKGIICTHQFYISHLRNRDITQEQQENLDDKLAFYNFITGKIGHKFKKNSYSINKNKTNKANDEVYIIDDDSVDKSLIENYSIDKNKMNDNEEKDDDDIYIIDDDLIDKIEDDLLDKNAINNNDDDDIYIIEEFSNNKTKIKSLETNEEKDSSCISNDKESEIDFFELFDEIYKDLETENNVKSEENLNVNDANDEVNKDVDASDSIIKDDAHNDINKDDANDSMNKDDASDDMNKDDVESHENKCENYVFKAKESIEQNTIDVHSDQDQNEIFRPIIELKENMIVISSEDEINEEDSDEFKNKHENYISEVKKIGKYFDKTLKKFQNVFTDIAHKCSKDSSYFSHGVQSFVDNYESNINSDELLFSSLQTFGMNSESIIKESSS